MLRKRKRPLTAPVLVLVLVDLGGKVVSQDTNRISLVLVLILVLVDLGGKESMQHTNPEEENVLILVLVDLGGKARAKNTPGRKTSKS